MFRRKEEESTTETETSANKDAKSESSNKVSPTSASSSNNSVTSPVAADNSTPAASAASASAPRPAEQKVSPMSQPNSNYRPVNAPAARPAGMPAPSAPSADNKAGGKKRILTVGNDILLKGEIATCDRLVIEGAVDAKLNDDHPPFGGNKQEYISYLEPFFTIDIFEKCYNSYHNRQGMELFIKLIKIK